MPLRVLIAGCGYLGTALGRHLVDQGAHVHGVVRTSTRAELIRSAGIEPIIADLSVAGSAGAIPGPWDWVVLCTAPGSDRAGVESYRRAYLLPANVLLESLAPAPPRALVFTSSTSVYSQTDGSIVTEDAPAEPGSPTVQVLRETERVLLAAVQRGFPARIIRSAGIYGPGRNRIDSFTAGLSGPGQEPSRWMNFIQRDDLVSAVVCVLERGGNGRIYNAADSAPATAGEFYQWLADRLGKASSPVPASLDQPRRPAGNKRVSASRLMAELAWRPQYPSFRHGYGSLLAMEPACRVSRPPDPDRGRQANTPG